MDGKRTALIVDTHVILWWALGDPRLTPGVRDMLLDLGSTRYVSAVSAFEISYKVKIGKLDAARELVERFDEMAPGRA